MPENANKLELKVDTDGQTTFARCPIHGEISDAVMTWERPSTGRKIAFCFDCVLGHLLSLNIPHFDHGREGASTDQSEHAERVGA